MAFDSDFGPRAIISTAALRHNLSVIRGRAPHSKVIAVIKANAYGHGLVPTARAFSAADALGVARLPEALVLRGHGVQGRVVLLEGVFTTDELAAAVAHDLEIVVHAPEQLALLREWRGDGALRVWLKVDTGMNRLGFRAEDFSAAWQALNTCSVVAPAIKVMTHLACADERGNAHTLAQLTQFNALAANLNFERSVVNSAGLLAWPQAQFEWVRPGLMLYGISPFNDDDASVHNLQAVMTLATRLIAVRLVRAGETVGYGGSWRAQTDVRVGIAAVGYGDGYPRQIASDSPVLVGGHTATIAGRVSMDMIAIDLSHLPSAAVGDEVTLWGKGLPVERIARCATTIPYELVCGISQRVGVDYRD
ncbi:MAG: alanine racemase [Candidatus Obscuribacterales bacterium]|nr:alanine racemase [Steroidobacteraceae bacterium]